MDPASAKELQGRDRVKILVTHVPAGAGHQRAAEVVAQSLKGSSGSAEVVLLNALEGVNPWYRWCFTRGYLWLIQQAPQIWGILYHLTDLSTLRRGVRWLHRTSNSRHARGLEAILLNARPEVIVGTHFLPMEVAAHLKESRRISARLVTVITDYLPHALWVVPGIDTYVVGSSQAKEDLLRRGIPSGKIELLGIPVDPKFSLSHDRSALARRLGLEPDRFILLIGSGGSGTGPIPALVDVLGKVTGRIQLLVVAGTNDLLYQRCEALKNRFPHPMQVYRFISNMDELMSVSDLIVTKAGGLTCAEALAKGLPLLLVSPIPGQESRNAQVLVQLGAALWAKSVPQVPGVVQHLLDHPEELEHLSRRSQEIRRPAAASQIAQRILDGI